MRHEKIEKAPTSPARVTIDLGAGCKAIYGRESGKIMLVDIEVPASAARDGVSNEKFVGRQRLINAKRKAKDYFDTLRAKSIQKATPVKPPEPAPSLTAQADPFNKWIGKNASPDIPKDDPRRFQTRVLEAQASDFLEHVPLDTNSKELVAGVRSVRARKAHRRRRHNEDMAIKRATAEAKRQTRAAEKARQQDLPF